MTMIPTFPIPKIAPVACLGVLVSLALAVPTAGPADAKKNRPSSAAAGSYDVAMAPLPKRGPRKAIDRDNPLQIVISLADQRLAVYRGGIQIDTSRVSTGKKTHQTPSGIFSILQKRPRHYSNLYGGAPMPNMQRITWSGVAMHAGNVPGYPASHGCIRLPSSFAKKLFGITNMSGHVVVTKQSLGDVRPRSIENVVLFQPTTLELLSGHARPEAEAAVGHVVLTSATTDATTTVSKVAPAPDVIDMGALGDIEMMADRASVIASRGEKPLRILITRRGQRNFASEVQSMLTQVGFDTGGVDGAVGRQTITQIKDFQESYSLPITGEINDTLIAKLYELTGRKEPSNAHILVRQGYKRIFEAPVTIKDDETPLGTHLYVAMDFDPSESSTEWTALTTESTISSSKESGPVRVASTASEALGRIEMPNYARIFVSDRLLPGTSLIIADDGHSYETGEYTDFIVQTR